MPVTLPPITSVPVDKFKDVPDHNTYSDIINLILGRLRPGHVEKVVLSRSHHVKIGKNVIDDDIVRNTLGFYLFYILIFAICSLVISINGLDMVSSLAISASSIGNIGPGLGVIGPSSDWGSLNSFSKLLGTFCMLLGRLEIFTVIVLFSRTYWKS